MCRDSQGKADPRSSLFRHPELAYRQAGASEGSS